MRIMIKGGVWKNTEDEILKAAVMKYGKNQWARISSLLVRKSAKQCKSRWYEWLDPSIKKTEWTREEDEKLLHLAKLMPTQWRTIAPIVGRTPAQCLERYEKLLDAACNKDENYDPAEDPRKLRPGEIDPNPESKPARPDPVDMDEDEKEMLSEARARLANTRGKKAKRKAREKQLEEARRLAALQKRRELKAAGIGSRLRKRKFKGIDYNAEIPFEKKPPPGFFDVSHEEGLVEHPKFPTTVEELEGKRRADAEAQLRKQDIAKNKIAQRQDAPSAIMQVNKLNDPEAVRKRTKLMLPAPQISDRELEEIAKMSSASEIPADEIGEGSSATQALVANYNQTPKIIPGRTPQRTLGGKSDAIMMEAENLARLRETQTPLFGGENPELHPSDFSGVTPKKREVQTPNVIATPLTTPGGIGATPRTGMTPRDSTFAMTPKGTPIRDEFHINESMDFAAENAKAEKLRQAELKRNLQASLKALPPAKNQYQIMIPKLPAEERLEAEDVEEDMADLNAKAKAEEAARQAAVLRKRSKVLQRDLPRPPVSAVEVVRSLAKREDNEAGKLILNELVAILEHDNAKYPVEDPSKKKASKLSNGNMVQLEDFEEEDLKEAARMINEESNKVRESLGLENTSTDDYVAVRESYVKDMQYFPQKSAYAPASQATTAERLSALQHEFDRLKRQWESENKRTLKMEQKLNVLTAGYKTRSEALCDEIQKRFKEAETLATELQCYKALHEREQLVVPVMIEELQEAVKQQNDKERALQSRFELAVSLRADLLKALQEEARVKMEREAARLQASTAENIPAVAENIPGEVAA